MNCIQWIGAWKWRMIHSASSFDQLADGPPKPDGQCFAKNKTVLVIIVGVPLGVWACPVTS